MVRNRAPEDRSGEQGIDEPVWIEGNGELLERALVNLLGNAIKYSNENTEVTMSVAVMANRVTINVRDQGFGIPEEELRHIFDPFFRSAEPKLAQNRGAGLGLRFVKTVVERHNGEVFVNSVWGAGTTFQLRLPLAD